MNAARAMRAPAGRARFASVWLEQARFARSYPGLYRHATYPTQDHIIPWQAFYALMAVRGHVLAEERVQLTQAVLMGVGQLFESKDPTAPHAASTAFTRDLRAAYPETE